MSGFTLSLVIHNHQPVGNFGFVFSQATEQAYAPMLAALERHPAIRLTLHHSGPLLDWLSAHQPDYLARLYTLVARGQVELLTGAYYEPILNAIPNADKSGQIDKMTRFLQETFDCKPTGAWLAERVWEPHLPKLLAESGVHYTVLDDTHFKMVGLTDDDLFGSYITEELGHTLKVFGSSLFLRYTIPWHPVEHVMNWLREHAEKSPGGIAVMGDDGEKFGLWPDTWDRCWGQEAWVEQFFTNLEANSDWLQTRPLGEVAAAHPPLGRIYLPTASYKEMMQWALPADDAANLGAVRLELEKRHQHDALRFIKGGFWRGFLTRYEEANHLHKKMLWVSRKVHQMPDGEQKDKALDHVWAAQCNCGYWHGLFGGIYLFHIRVANYAHLIAAEELADAAAPQLTGASTWAYVERGDLDSDGYEEIVLNTDRHVLTFKPSYGGALAEWDWRKPRYNLLNTMARYWERYHPELIAAGKAGKLILPDQEAVPGKTRVKAPHIHNHIFGDAYRRLALLDHFVHPNTTLKAFYKGRHKEKGDFVDQPYAVQIDDSGSTASLTLTREGTAKTNKGLVPVRVEKRVTISAGSDEIVVQYQLQSPERAILRFGVEINWGIVGGNSEWGVFLVNKEPHDLGDIRERELVSSLIVGSTLPDLEGQVSLALDQPATLWYFPLESVTNSEAGYELGYQGTCALLLWRAALYPGKPWQVALHLTSDYTGDKR